MQSSQACAGKLFSGWLFAALLSGCASPAQHMDEQAAAHGYRKVVVQGDGYDHVAYLKEATAPGSTLHVYLEGDGTPWLRKGVAAPDPTPHTPLMLELMSQDPAPAVYLGRPCYSGMNKAKACTPELWTSGRYSEAVVASMSVALDRLSAGHGALVLLGYSGGGTLAMLLAEHQPRTESVVTVAANLDTDRWAALHGQAPLLGSLNPALRPPLLPRIRQLHFAGADDENVPPVLVHDAIAQQPGAQFRVLPQQDHRCCWRTVWPQVLSALKAE